MKHTSTLVLFSAMLSASASGQLLVRYDAFTPSSVTNDGLIAGYLEQGGTLMIWNPDLSSTEDIGGMAPGNGVGGQPYFSTDGQRIGGTSAGAEGAEIATYDRTTGEWTPHGGLGMVFDGTIGGGFSLSGDGQTVVGLSWGDTTGGLPIHAHAVAHNTTEGLMDLGTLFAGRSTRANAVSADGSVVVGWQDFNGPWKSAVWKKDPLGGYYANTYILIDEDGDPNDEFNQIGECSSVSGDGTWIGGYGDYANNNRPWLWSEATGVIDLGALPLTGRGFVSGMSADASVVVGWFDGELFGDPRTPFVWTAAGGLRDLNTYITDVLNIDMGQQHIYVASAISPDGQYVTGYGIDNSDFSIFAYRVDLGASIGLNERNAAGVIDVYPNPVLNVINFRSPAMADLTIHSADGTLVRSGRVSGNVSLDLSDLAAGVYSMALRSGGMGRTQKIIKL